MVQVQDMRRLHAPASRAAVAAVAATVAAAAAATALTARARVSLRHPRRLQRDAVCVVVLARVSGQARRLQQVEGASAVLAAPQRAIARHSATQRATAPYEVSPFLRGLALLALDARHSLGGAVLRRATAKAHS